MVPSLWKRYKHETFGLEVIEKPWGLAAFICAPDSVFIDEFYVIPEHRKEGLGMELLEEIKEYARRNGRHSLTSTVSLSSKTAALSIAAQLAVGFIPIRAEDGNVLFKLILEV